MRVSARVVWPIASSPISNGALLVDAQGRIVEVGPDAGVSAPPGVATVALPEALLLPGLVNVHTHLELHGFRGLAEEPDFFDWIQHIRRLKQAASAQDFVTAARQGLRDAWHAGITTVADTGTSGATVRALTELGGRGIYYHEVIAPEPARAANELAKTRVGIRQLAEHAGRLVRIGISPHAPYTVSEELIARAAALARREHLPLAAHVAESRVEAAFVTRGEGVFANLWRSRGLPLPEPERSAVAYLDRLGLLGPDLLAIHVVQADEDDVALLAARGVAVALCPRSNLRHGHGAPPLASLLARGVRTGLGTDSVASVDSLDLLAEAREARKLVGGTAAQMVQVLTSGGAEALGLTGEIGSLEVGKWADCCALTLPAEEVMGDALAEAALAAQPDHVQLTTVAGRIVYRG